MQPEQKYLLWHAMPWRLRGFKPSGTILGKHQGTTNRIALRPEWIDTCAGTVAIEAQDADARPLKITA
jgi:hypothetical protein